MLDARFGADLVDHYTYVIAGDGCLHGGHQPRGDRPRRPSAARPPDRPLGRQPHLHRRPDLALDLDRPAGALRAPPAGTSWRVDGHDPEAVAAAIAGARSDRRPSLIACRTTIGYGAPTKQGSREASTARRSARTRSPPPAQQLGWPHAALRGARRRRAPPGATSPHAAARRAHAWERAARGLAAARRLRDARSRGELPRPRFAALARATGAEHRRRGAEGRDPQGLRDGARARQRRDRPAPSAARPTSPARTCTRTKGMAPVAAGRLRRPLHPLRHPRARHGRGDERHRAARRLHPLRRHLPRLRRLLPPGASGSRR